MKTAAAAASILVLAALSCRGAPPASQREIKIRQLALGRQHACALADDGTVHCWGHAALDEYGGGELGDGTTRNRPRAAPVPGLAHVVRIAAAQASTCAVRDDGHVLCWGFGQARLLTMRGPVPGPVQPFTRPVEVPGIDRAVDVAVAPLVAWIRLRDEGWVEATRSRERDWIVSAPRDAGQVQLECSISHCCRRMKDGRVTCEGQDQPPEVALRGAVDVRVGKFATCVRALGGRVGCRWLELAPPPPDGTNDLWGPGVVEVRSLQGMAQVFPLDRNNLLARGSDGAVWAWGPDVTLIEGPRPDAMGPTPISGIDDAVDLAVGSEGLFACAIRAGGDALCWGANDSGQLGDGTFTPRATPAPVLFGSSAPKPGGKGRQARSHESAGRPGKVTL